MEKSKIKFIKSLGEKRTRNESKLFVAEGIKLVCELLNTNLIVEEIYFTYRLDREVCELFSGKKYELISENEMQRISQLKTATPILALIRINECGKPFVEDGELCLALDGVQDPGNMGTIVRVADWFGITKIFCSYATADIYNPKVVQATMGAISRVEVFYLDLESHLSDLSKNGVAIYVTSLDGEDIYNKPLQGGGVVVMGNEGKGVSEPILKIAKERLFIPSYGKSETSESLNVGVATAIICAEFRRRLTI